MHMAKPVQARMRRVEACDATMDLVAAVCTMRHRIHMLTIAATGRCMIMLVVDTSYSTVDISVMAIRHEFDPSIHAQIMSTCGARRVLLVDCLTYVQEV